MLNIFEKAMSVDDIENGVWRQPDNPVGGEPFVNDKGEKVEVRIRSVASRRYRDWRSKQARGGISTMIKGRGKKSADTKLIAEASKDDKAEQFAELVSGFRNVDGPGTTEPSTEDLLAFVADKVGDAWIIRSGMVWIVEWVLGIANDDSEYGIKSDAEGNAGARQTSSGSRKTS